MSWLAAHREIVSLIERVDRIASELDCEESRVTAFLFTGKAFDLPWIDIETAHTGLGPRFIVHVGTADITAEEVRRAYQQKMREYHPDRVANAGAELRELAERRSKEINAAYDAMKKR